jgi:hypothetical protein
MLWQVAIAAQEFADAWLADSRQTTPTLRKYASLCSALAILPNLQTMLDEHELKREEVEHADYWGETES